MERSARLLQVFAVPVLTLCCVTASAQVLRPYSDFEPWLAEHHYYHQIRSETKALYYHKYNWRDESKPREFFPDFYLPRSFTSTITIQGDDVNHTFKIDLDGHDVTPKFVAGSLYWNPYNALFGRAKCALDFYLDGYIRITNTCLTTNFGTVTSPPDRMFLAPGTEWYTYTATIQPVLNELGKPAAYARAAFGLVEAWVVPEPSTVAIVLPGFLWVGRRRRRPISGTQAR
jgi:hypothetical protein